MKNVNPTLSLARHWIIGVLYGLLLAGLAFIVIGNEGQLRILPVLAIFILGVAGVLCAAAWRHGFRWFFTRRAWCFYGWFIVGIISVIILFYAEEGWRGKRAWARLQREAAARGESLELSSVFPPPVPDEENFALAPGLPQMLGYAAPEPGATWQPTNFDSEDTAFFHGQRDKWPAANWAFQQTTDLAAWQKFFRRHPLTSKTPTNDNVSRLYFPVPPEPQAPAADVLLGLSRYDSALALLRAASQRPNARYPLAYDLGLFALISPRSFHAENLHNAVHVLCLRAVAELAQDQSEPALQDTLLAWRLADSLRQQPFEQLHRFRNGLLLCCLQPVWEGLASHRWSEAQLVTLQQRFADEDLLAEFRLVMRGNTLVMMDLADQFHSYFLRGRRSPMGDHFARFGDEPGARFFTRLCRVAYPVGWLYQDKVWFYRYYERRADVFKTLDPANFDHSAAEIQRATDPFLVILAAPKFQEVFRVHAPVALFFQTACQEAMVACALERYRLARGQYPDSLETLIPTWLKQVPADLCDPKAGPLKYRREADDGFVLYSIGLDHVDDQGRPGIPDGSSPPFPRLDQGDWVWAPPKR